ncbi:MAG: methylated-DNA--[protein]-cysteine S-methyltransferase [Staphylococcus simulans]|uniref:methylated-DNA--[protein]-cysteine S-methyltransferase n=1 Tax=Staphylococcus TaxID=1279 RepID=UPI0008AA1FA7|nr:MULTISPECIES: methylated-DNA--[protein]-cysteine S-methyltransferase [Staphylococcus]MDK7928028.1 methylated-DNA--[protein]-cysteine S-methyltransferase [Staphylococcus simulans]MDK8316672.1 methylated-DNA--[protein]-cysteine S-methyltransferase [Staphylococcus simulans]OHR48306.1 cysteine methyltransferase [Staphylococcus sp. HMSC056D08]OHS48593.1 cysteine methyltransferase [Staphylococcus sp. HMSC65H10]
MTKMSDYQSPIGTLTLVSEDDVLTGIYYEGQINKEDPNIDKVALTSVPVFNQVSDWLDRYFKEENPEINFKYHASGTEFREQVWNELVKIPYGELVTYGDIARKIAQLRGKKKMSAQAVGGAVGSNPISIIIPCHRVVGHHNKLTGYGGGLDRKRYLLECEHHDLNQFTT